jgi:hypothetical protein
MEWQSYRKSYLNNIFQPDFTTQKTQNTYMTKTNWLAMFNCRKYNGCYGSIWTARFKI